jgi:pilus assembly protein Flp/PilA
VEMLRSLPMRAYLAVTSLQDSLREREEGQALVEYALLLSLIAVVSIVVLGTLGHRVSRIFSTISAQL